MPKENFMEILFTSIKRYNFMAFFKEFSQKLRINFRKPIFTSKEK